MPLDVDTILDRRTLARRVSLWRALAVLAVLLAIIAGVGLRGDLFGPHIARLDVSGTITSDRPLLTLIDKLGKDDAVAGVLVSINSPGGTSVGGERLFNALRKLDAKKPVVAHITTLGASAAYMTALASDHIVAQRTSLTGSIGVLIQYGQINELLDNLGIEIAKVDSGPLKAEPNPFEKVDPEAVRALQSVVDDTFLYFLNLVIERRNMPEAKARALADGRIFTGAQALEDGLIDAIGGEDAAISWLEDERDVPENLSVKTYQPKRDDDGSLLLHAADALVRRTLAAFGIEHSSSFPAGSIDGLWSVWHAPSATGGHAHD